MCLLFCGVVIPFCQNCILGLQPAVLKLLTQQFKIPLFISCPWCHSLSLRLVYKGNLKFPCKNFFLLWMIESLNGDRYGVIRRTSSGDYQPLILGNQAIDGVFRRGSYAHSSEPMRPEDNVDRSNAERHHFSLHKSLDFFIHFTSKFPLVIIFLLIVFFVIPGNAVILLLYLLMTVVFAIPSFLVLYFVFPMLNRLVREIIS
ncbi:hypothetical protein REPUB_Repub01dG0022100 [Reevesia pubescens]